MASLGQLVAGVAHEINTPLGALRSNLDTSSRVFGRLHNILSDAESDWDRRELTEPFDRIVKLNSVSDTAIERIVTIADSLRRFARLDEAELGEVDIHEGLESTLTLLHHRFGDRIEVHKDYGAVPLIQCYPNQLNQVFMNLLVNADQAIESRGQIFIKTRFQNDSAVIEIRDTGTGIPDNKLKRIFDPGFTTKGLGVGTGLGLSIVYQIIQDHKGEIAVESEVGKGTLFRLILLQSMKNE